MKTTDNHAVLSEAMPDLYAMNAQARRRDLTVVIIIGTAILIMLSALTHMPIVPAIIACAGFVIASMLYMRFAPQSEALNPAYDRRMTPRRAAYMGEARLAEGFVEAIVILDKRLRIDYANPAAQTMLKIEQLGMPIATVLREPAVIDMLGRVISGEPAGPVTFHEEGAVDRYYRAACAGIRSDFPHDTDMRILVVFYDITDIVRSNDMRSDFLANASHELKTPIASLLGYIETLRGHARGDEAVREQFLGIMQAQAERMQRLIDDLLSLRRIEMLEHLIPTETADAFLAIRAAKEAVVPLAKQRNVKIKISGLKKAPVKGAQDELVQLFLNLIDNAVQISDPKMAVTIKIDALEDWHPDQQFETESMAPQAPRRRICNPVDMNGDFFRIRIRDDGPGFEREHLPRIGERFYRIAGDRKNRGTGLGLAIVKHIVRRHQGGLYIESVRDVGTEFTILLPLAADDAMGGASGGTSGGALDNLGL